VSSSGSGTVRSDLGGISCGKACTASLPAYTVVVLTAAPGEGSSFIGWSGACSGSGTTCRLRMDERKDVTATFTDPPTPIGPTDPPIGPVGSVAVFDGERLHVRLKCGARFKPECNMTAVPVTRKDRKVKRVRKGRKIIQVTRGVPMAKPVKRKISAGKWVQVTFLVKPRFRATLEAMAKRKVKTLFVKQRIRSRKIGRRSFKGKPRVVWSRYLVRRVG